MADWADETAKSLRDAYWLGFARDQLEVSASDLAAALREARATALEEAAKFHDVEIAKLDAQIERNNEYMRRSKDYDSTANDYCRHVETVHRISADAIRALARPTSEKEKEKP